MNREVSLQCQDTSLQKVDVTNDVNKSFIIQMFSEVMLQPCPVLKLIFLCKVRPQRELKEVHPWCDKIFEKKSADAKGLG